MLHDAVDGLDELGGRLVRTHESHVQALLEVLHHGAVDNRHLAGEDLARGAVDGERLALADDQSRLGDEQAALRVDVERLGTAHAGLAHAACHDGRMRGLPAAAGEDARRRDHALEVIGVRLTPDEDHVLSGRRPLDSRGRVEHDPADSGPGRCVHAAGDEVVRLVGAEAREHQLRELRAVHAHEGLVHRDDALIDQLDRDAERRPGRALAHAGLQHPQLAPLDRELDVAQVAVVQLEPMHDVHELRVRGRVDCLEVLQRHRVADAGDDVLALGIGQVVAVDATRTRARVARERHAGAGAGAGVAERHRLHVDRRAEVVRDALLPAVEPRAVGVPRREHGHDREVELLVRVLRERLARAVEDDRLVDADEVLQRLHRQFDVGGDLEVDLLLLERVLEVVAVQAEDGLAEHLDEAPIGVPREVLVVGVPGEPVDALVVESDVEDRLHHARHREAGARSHGHEQGVLRRAQRTAHLLLQPRDMLRDLVAEALGALAVEQVVAAGLRGDREPRRHRQPHARHLGEIGALPAQQVLLGAVALDEVEDEGVRGGHGGVGSRHGLHPTPPGVPAPRAKGPCRSSRPCDVHHEDARPGRRGRRRRLGQ